ncbi:MAG: 23S rRNA (adenine(2503)-C(2))-methyltransferase RlmN, partial [Alphaproteobacteria bacterium]|nr:23S rRNA (adenine(2503)-C(2))-methyltransferase RlmN [Alphaproteobacteria bacterium]
DNGQVRPSPITSNRPLRGGDQETPAPLLRGTLCISSQIGCSLSCRFCHTGTQKLVRNLTAGEILAQILVAKDALGDWGREGQERAISNIVFMGMGEPLYNTDAVIEALKIMIDDEGLGFSKRKVTVSTSGIVPDIYRLGDETGANLAVSLHAPRDDLRDILMPINKKYPLKDLLAAVANYPAIYQAHHKSARGDFQGRRVTWEYVMIKDVNDKATDAHQLVQLVKGIPSKINLIPFNPWPGSDYSCSDDTAMDLFAGIVRGAGYAVPRRRPRGRDITAACGQLRSDSLRLSYQQQQALKKLSTL